MYVSMNVALLLCAVVAATMYYVLGGDVSYLNFILKGTSDDDTPGTTALREMNHRGTTVIRRPDNKTAADATTTGGVAAEQEQSLGYTDESVYFDSPATTNKHHQGQAGEDNSSMDAADWSSKRNTDFF